MKLICPCIAARISNLAPRGISRSALVAPSKGGTSGHKLLTVPALGLPVKVSTIRQAETTMTIRATAVAVLKFFFLFLQNPPTMRLRQSDDRKERHERKASQAMKDA